jgi:hypothetical protein
MAPSGILRRGQPSRPLPSPHARAWRLAPLTAQELLAALASAPGAKVVPARGDGIVESRVVGGVEIARSDERGDQELRKVWRARFGGGPTPLLLIADDPTAAGVVRTLGPLGHDGPIRRVDADALRGVLDRLPTLGRLEAVRELAEELDRLDRGGVSGLDAVLEAHAPKMGQPGWLPDEDAIRRAEYRTTTPGQRVADAISISRTATKLAVAGGRRRER